jgi:hypothetical protein
MGQQGQQNQPRHEEEDDFGTGKAGGGQGNQNR